MDPSLGSERSGLVRGWWAVGLLAWCWLVYALSAESDPAEGVEWILSIPDWLAHGLEYAVGGVLAWGTFRGSRRLTSWGLALGFLLVRAVLDEWHQSFVPGRSPEVADVLADLVGGVAGTLTHACWDLRAGRAEVSRDSPGEAK